MDLDVTRKWKLGSITRLHWYVSNDESVVFDEASGDTHLFEPVSVEVLRFLEDSVSSRSMHDIVQDLSPMPNENEEEILGHVQKVIATFNRLGLVEPDHT